MTPFTQITQSEKQARYLKKKSVKDFLKTTIKTLSDLQKARKRAGHHNLQTYEEMVVKPVTEKIHSIIKNKELQGYSGCCRRVYYEAGTNSRKPRPATDLEIVKELEYFLSWIKYKGTYWGQVHGEFFDKIAKSYYEEWQKQEIPWPEFPIEV